MNNDLIAIIASSIILLSPFYFKRKHDIPSMSGLTTTLGILGTFVGIFIGLIGFDVSDLAGSVPQLLEGLKTAFLTSIAGMVASLILRESPILYGIRVSTGDAAKEQASLENMIRLLSTIEKNQRELFQKESQQLVTIEKALCGEGETTLLTQIQKLRTSFADKQDELIASFNEFAEKVAENNSKALIDALTQVMRDFNTKINEQFGDNFKRLNEAVGKVLEWQQEYGRQVDLMVKQIQATVIAVEKSSETVKAIIGEAKAFAATAKDLHTLITTLEQIRRDMEGHLKAFEQLASNAKSAFPVIDEQLRRLTTDLSKSVERAVADTKNMVNLQLETTKQTGASLAEAQRILGTSLAEVVKSLNQQIERMMKDNADRIAQQVKVLDEQLGEELNKALRTLGSQLTSLSGKFVQDYTPLTEQLKKVVQMAGAGRA